MGSIDYPAAFRPRAQWRLAVIGPQRENSQSNSFLINIHFPRPSSSSATILEIRRAK